MTSRTFLKKALCDETSKISNASLKDFNWQVKLVMSSDKLANIKEPMVNVVFEMQTEDGCKTKSLEMNKEELKVFIDSLEGANKSENVTEYLQGEPKNLKDKEKKATKVTLLIP